MKPLILALFITLTANPATAGDADLWCMVAIGQAIACRLPPSETHYCAALVRSLGRFDAQKTADWIEEARDYQRGHLDTCPRVRRSTRGSEAIAAGLLFDAGIDPGPP